MTKITFSGRYRMSGLFLGEHWKLSLFIAKEGRQDKNAGDTTIPYLSLIAYQAICKNWTNQ